MNKSTMKLLKPYVVTKGSTDHTLITGNIIWLSPNMHLNVYPDRGFLLEDEWTSIQTNDFEVIEACNWEVTKMNDGSERLVKIY